MEILAINIDKETEDNTAYRNVIFTNERCQIALQSLEPGVEIGEEIHRGLTQFIKVEEGSVIAILNGDHYRLKPGDCIVIPENTRHNVINTESIPAKLYTVYCGYGPHPPETYEETKEDEINE